MDDGRTVYESLCAQTALDEAQGFGDPRAETTPGFWRAAMQRQALELLPHRFVELTSRPLLLALAGNPEARL
jgi:hypothetical protein